MKSPFEHTELSAFDNQSKHISEQKYKKTTQEIKKSSLNDPTKWQALGKAAEQAGKWKQAMRAYKQALELDDSNEVIWNDLGVSFVMLKKFDDAQSAFLTSLSINPDYPNARFNLNDLNIQKKAREELEGLQDERENGAGYRRKRDTQGISVDKVMKKIRENPKNYRLWIGLANLHCKDEQYSEMAKCLRKACKLNPSRSKSWWSLSKAQQTNNHISKAVRSMEKYIELEPACPHGWVRMSKLLVLDNKRKRAISAAQNGLKYGPDQTSTWRHWANIADTLLEDESSTEQALLKVVELEPTSAPDWFNLGLLRQKKADRSGAVKAFKEALSNNPNNNDYWIKLGRALESIGEVKAAEELYVMLSKKSPEDPRSWNSLGVLKSIAGDPDKAKQYFEIALESDPKFSNAWYNLRDLRLSLGDKAGAIAAERQAKLVSMPS